MTKDIDQTREMNAKKKQVEEAIAELKTLMGNKEASISISALTSYLCMLSWDNNYPLEQLGLSMAGLYAQHMERDNAADT
jgi:hypothetical protein